MKLKFGKILKSVLPIAGALLGAKFFGSWGGLIGGVLGGLVGSSRVRLRGSEKIQSYIPPYAQKGADLLMQLLNQTPQISQTTANIMRPYINKAIASIESMPTDIRDVFDSTKSEIQKYYDDLLKKQSSIIQTEQAKQNLKLGVLGLLNTQAQQWTMADILNKTAFETLREKTKALTNLTGAQTKSLVDYLFARPDYYISISEKLVQTDPSVLEFQTKMDIAKALMGVPTIVQSTYKKGLLDYLPAFAQLGTAFMLLRR